MESWSNSEHIHLSVFYLSGVHTLDAWSPLGWCTEVVGSLRLGYIGRSFPLQNIPLEEIEVILLESRVISHKNCYKKNNLFTLHTCSDILSHRWWLPLTYTYAFLMMLSAKSVLELRNFGDEAFSPQKGVLKKVFFLRDTDTETSIYQTYQYTYVLLAVFTLLAALYAAPK